jgi:hypothetical protein
MEWPPVPFSRLPIQLTYWTRNGWSNPSRDLRAARVSGEAFMPRMIWAGSPGRTNNTVKTVRETRKSTAARAAAFLIR